MELNPYLSFNGQCEAAFKFYAQCLGGTIEAMRLHEAAPAASPVPAEWRKKILHARLTVGGEVLMGSDVPPELYQPARGFSVSLRVSESAEAERIFHSLAENGQVQMPIQPIFWAPRFGMLVDQFGIPWMVSCERAEK